MIAFEDKENKMAAKKDETEKDEEKIRVYFPKGATAEDIAAAIREMSRKQRERREAEAKKKLEAENNPSRPQDT